jgi:hypothetical protein
MQAAIACGSMTSQTPAFRSRVRPSCWSGRTTRSDGTAVILTIAASAEAAARNARSELHHGGKATATISVPGRTCNDSAATATKLAISNAAALSQTGHRRDEMVMPRSIARKNTRAQLMSSKCSVSFLIVDANVYRCACDRARSSIEDSAWLASSGRDR